MNHGTDMQVVTKGIPTPVPVIELGPFILQLVQLSHRRNFRWSKDIGGEGSIMKYSAEFNGPQHKTEFPILAWRGVSVRPVKQNVPVNLSTPKTRGYARFWARNLVKFLHPPTPTPITLGVFPWKFKKSFFHNEFKTTVLLCTLIWKNDHKWCYKG